MTISALDEAMETMGAQLRANLDWLDNAFGRAWKIERMVNRKRYKEPCVYVGNGVFEYLSVLPSADHGNYSFFYIKDPQEFVGNTTQMPVSLIFWFNIEKIRGDRNTDALKEEIVKVLNEKLFFDKGSIEFNRCYEEYRNVFDGFTIDENDQQAFVHPYAGFRFDGTLHIELPCTI